MSLSAAFEVLPARSVSWATDLVFRPPIIRASHHRPRATAGLAGFSQGDRIAIGFATMVDIVPCTPTHRSTRATRRKYRLNHGGARGVIHIAVGRPCSIRVLVACSGAQHILYAFHPGACVAVGRIRPMVTFIHRVIERMGVVASRLGSRGRERFAPPA